MDIGFAIFLAAVLVCVCIVLPIVAIVRTARIRHLELRLAGVEAALRRLMLDKTPLEKTPLERAPLEKTPPETPPLATPIAAPPPPAPPIPEPQPQPAPVPAEHLEAVIGQKWIGWVAVLLIFCAVAFFLKYAFENRWIGELGRVALGVIIGLVFAWGGLERHRKGWPYLSQVLTGGGITILYLSVYGAFGYYHLVDQRAAFIFLAILVAEAHLLALVYDARSIAVMALAGGFLAPVLLSTGRDQYAVLFTYIVVLDLGMLLAVLARRWRWIGSLAYAATQLLFWAWYSEHYHPSKRAAALLFQAAIFALFMLADLAPRLRRRATVWEEWIRLAVNPFVFYAICYFLLNDDHHDWMAPLALALAIVYAALARAGLGLRPADRRMLLVTVGTALTFVTLAIPIQLESNWITIAWALEAAALLWASFEAAAPPLRVLSAIVFALSLIRFVFQDTPWESRAIFTPVLNRYYLGTLALTACLAAAAYLYRRAPGEAALRACLVWGLLAAGVIWVGSSVEAYTWFSSQADAALRSTVRGAAAEVSGLRWSGQLALSILWSVFAGSLTAAGFRFEQRALRVAGLVLFGITLVKVVFLDISELRQFYRILALLALGLVLMAVAWAYQRGVRRGHAR
ncbi:conserved membrane hypothetical protein [Candidatus Sulfopaludibacter sp. SbA4]|nr:conserved membrane hypothetical protein [Candidatus Sulfopaludibacter sp. SbA4]